MINENLVYPKHRYIIGLLLCISAGMAIFANSMINPLLTYISNDIGIDIITAGIIATITALFLGLSTLFGGIFIGKIKNKVLMIIALAIITIGQIIVFFSYSLVVILIGRAFVGLGFGIISVSSVSIYTSWFSAKERPIIITATSLSIAAFMYLSTVITIPMYNVLGNSWRHLFLLVGSILIIIMFGWLIFGKENEAYKEYLNSYKADTLALVKKQSGLIAAMKRRDVWLLVGFAGLTTIAATGIACYLIPFLQIRGYSAKTAANYASIISIAGVPGYFISGVLTTVLGKRKLLFLPASILAAAGILTALFFKLSAGIITGLIVYGFCNSIRLNLSSTVVTELDGVTPEIAAGGSSVVFGLGSVFGFILPTILAAIKTLDLNTVMIIFAALLLMTILFGFMIKDTGPKAIESIETSSKNKILPSLRNNT